MQEVLALGGMGIIYSGRHEVTGRSVAIKLLRAELATQPDVLRRVTAEARLAVEASHPNVVEVLDAGADAAGTPYLVLERLYGKSLDAVIGERLPLIVAARALVPVMNALGALHGAGIVHRDIKPSNIFLSREGELIIPKLLDFGIAKVVAAGDSTHSNLALGTPSYMAPEQAMGYARLGPAADIWSMGVVLVRCLTGRLPFEALPDQGPSALRSGLRADQWAQVPASVGAVLVRALELDPRDRFSSMFEFRSALLAGLRQVDELAAWPGDTTVSYSVAEFSAESLALGSSLAGVEQPPCENAGRPARPEDVRTRTLPGAGQALVGAPRKLVTIAISMALGTAAALALGLWKSAPAPSRGTGSAQPLSLAAGLGTDALIVSAARENAERGPVTSSQVPDGTAAADGHPETAPSAPAPAPRRARRAPAPHPLDALPVEAPREPVLGPNRAPIIE